MSNPLHAGVIWLLVSATPPALPAPYIDGTYGFRLQPPAGWQALRECRYEDNGFTLLRLVHRSGASALDEIAVRLITTPHATQVSAVLDDIRATLTKSLRHVEVQARPLQPVNGRPAGHVVATSEAAGRPVVLLESVIQSEPRQFFVLAFQGPAAARPVMEPVFLAVRDSFRVLGDESSDRTLRQALLAGADWQRSLSSDDLSALAADDSYLLITLDGEPVGFMRTAIEPTTYSARSGLAVRERGWTFGASGQARRLYNDLFVSLDRQAERWEFRTTTYTPPRGDEPSDLAVALEEAVREQDRLLSSQQSGLGAAAESNQPIVVPPTYVARALVRLMPRLLTHRPRSPLLAFNEFNHERRGLQLLTVELDGGAGPVAGGEAAAPRAAGRPGAASHVARLRQREGLFGDPTDLYLDASGRVVRMVTAGLVMTRTTRGEVDRRFGRQIADAEEGIRRLGTALEQAYSRQEQRLRPK